MNAWVRTTGGGALASQSAEWAVVGNLMLDYTGHGCDPVGIFLFCLSCDPPRGIQWQLLLQECPAPGTGHLSLTCVISGQLRTNKHNSQVRIRALIFNRCFFIAVSRPEGFPSVYV